MKKQITQSEYLTLLGIEALAARFQILLQELIVITKGITGETEDTGHCGDMVWGGDGADVMLRKMHISVRPAPKKVRR